MAPETIREACLRVERQWKAQRSPAARAARVEVLAAAIDEGVTYRDLAAAISLSYGALFALVDGHVHRSHSVKILDLPFRERP